MRPSTLIVLAILLCASTSVVGDLDITKAPPEWQPLIAVGSSEGISGRFQATLAGPVLHVTAEVTADGFETAVAGNAPLAQNRFEVILGNASNDAKPVAKKAVLAVTNQVLGEGVSGGFSGGVFHLDINLASFYPELTNKSAFFADVVVIENYPDFRKASWSGTSGLARYGANFTIGDLSDPEMANISDLPNLPDGKKVQISGVLTASLDSGRMVSLQAESHGYNAIWLKPVVAEVLSFNGSKGKYVELSGVLATDNQMRVVKDASLIFSSPSDLNLKPLEIRPSQVGGTTVGNSPGPHLRGAYNLGMLTRITGKVNGSSMEGLNLVSPEMVLTDGPMSLTGVSYVDQTGLKFLVLKGERQ